MKLLFLLMLNCFHTTAQNMFPLLIVSDSTTLTIEVLQIITEMVDGEEKLVDFMEDIKVEVVELDSLHYYVRLPAKGFYVVTPICNKTKRRKPLYVHTENIWIKDPFVVTPDFENHNSMNIKYNKAAKSYQYLVIRED